jgi:uncharacterized protein (TIGR03000 family)
MNVLTWRTGWAAAAVAAVLLVAPESRAQVYSRIGVHYSPSPGTLGLYATSPYYTVPTYGDINGYPPRFYASVASGALPTYMTSINYPWMYGAYGYYYAPGRFVFGATPSEGTTAPTLYGVYLPPDNPDRVILDAASTPVVTTANIDVHLPPDAELRFDGTFLAETGAVRHFVTPALVPGTSYVYDISATWLENGQRVTSDRHVRFQAGDRLSVDLTAPPPAEERSSTLRAAPAPRP